MKIKKMLEVPPFGVAEADIQKCAYFLWQEEGCPSGRDLDLWLRARELVRHHAAVPPGGRRKNCTSMAKKRGAAPKGFG